MARYDKLTKIWHGPKVIESTRSFTRELFESLQKTPNKVAQVSVSENTELTYDELRLLSVRTAQSLLDLKVQVGDVIGIIARNSTFLAPVAFGCFLIGAPVNSLDVSQTKEDIKHMWNITKPKIIFCDPEKVVIVEETLKEINLSAKIFTLIEKIEGFGFIDEILEKTGRENEFKPVELTSDAIVAIMCSSGTTGASKGIICTQAHFNCSLQFWKVHESSRLFCASSLYWLTGVWFLIKPIFSNGVRVISNVNTDMDQILDIFVKEQITDSFISPGGLAVAIKNMAKNGKKCLSIENILCGGSFVYSSIRKELNDYFPNATFRIAYGSTEVNVMCSLTQEPTCKKKDSLSVGVLRDNNQAKLLDEVDKKPLGINEIGEIYVKCPENVCKGYYKNAETTKNSFDSDGFFKTGDLGYFNEDGFFFISDRRSDMIRICNPNIINVYPSTIENVVMRIKGVNDACVVPVKHPIFIEVPAVMVIKDQNSQVTENEISEVLLKELGLTMFGDEILIYFMDDFQKTASGKVQKRLVKNIAIEKFNKSHDYVF